MSNGYLALGLTFTLGLILYPKFIAFLKKTTAQQKVSEYALDEFKEKKDTVTFGGVLFTLLTLFITLLIGFQYLTLQSFVVLVVFFGYGLLGFIDDYKIIKEGRNDGLSALSKIVIQVVLAILFYFGYIKTGGSKIIEVPIFHVFFDLGLLYLPFIAFMFTAYSNAVNITDGMDGLAAGTTIFAFLPFLIYTLRADLSFYSILIFSLMGAVGSFGVYNYKPAKIFMGDVGSLALGALFAMMAVILKKELLSLIIGGVFVYETLTVVIQQVAVRIFRKRVFKYTPIHYSFTLSGWEEVKVVHFFWFLSLCFGLLGLWIGSL